MALVSLSMPEEVNTHPSPKVEEHMNRYGSRLQLTVKAQAGASAAPWQVFLHTAQVKHPAEDKRNKVSQCTERQKPSTLTF